IYPDLLDVGLVLSRNNRGASHQVSKVEEHGPPHREVNIDETEHLPALCIKEEVIDLGVTMNDLRPQRSSGKRPRYERCAIKEGLHLLENACPPCKSLRRRVLGCINERLPAA